MFLKSLSFIDSVIFHCYIVNFILKPFYQVKEIEHIILSISAWKIPWALRGYVSLS